ncbi:hypothetical protein ACS0TY_025153 [Phlomoides rotata]
MTSVSTEPPTLRSVPSVAVASFSENSAPQRRSYRCYNCNYSFHIEPTSTTSPSQPSSFRCPGCHHRHLIPYHTISLPLPPLPPPAIQTRNSSYAPASDDFIYQSSDSEDESDSDEEYVEGEDEDEEEYESDNSAVSLTTPDSHPSTPTSKSFVGSLPIKAFSSNSAPPLQSCTICMEDFVVNSDKSVTVNELPCEHYFHKDCIVEWLQRSNSCPLCRYKLPVDPVPEERPDPNTTQWDVEYDAVLVGDVARASEPTGERINREESLNSEANTANATNAAASESDVGGLSVNGGETSNWNVDAMRDEDGDTLMIDA